MGSIEGVAVVVVLVVWEGEVAEDERDADAMRLSLLFCFEEEVDVAAAAADVVVSRASSLLSPTRVASPLKVTSAFSLSQVRFAALKRARMTDSKSGMEKLA